MSHFEERPDIFKVLAFLTLILLSLIMLNNSHTSFRSTHSLHTEHLRLEQQQPEPPLELLTRQYIQEGVENETKYLVENILLMKIWFYIAGSLILIILSMYIVRICSTPDKHIFSSTLTRIVLFIQQMDGKKDHALLFIS